MARVAFRPSTLFRPRKAEAGRTASRARTAKTGRAASRPGKAKAVRSGRTAKGPRARWARIRPTAWARRSPRPGAAAERRPLPWPVRLPAMGCAFVFMVAFAVVLARLTLQPSPSSTSLVHTNLHPGRSLRATLDQPGLREAVKQIGGNLLLGVPFGVLVPVVAPGARGPLRVLLLTVTVMLMVEFAQGALITGRAFDIDDVILNTTGALVGYLLLGRRLGRAVHARRLRERA
ncbi:VanZ family protein [Streptomyces sp. NRRL S-813]|uniref:VanZ family protein n=1 Tax=Streptomyces sp. NRRL S-813 TaxID=1463919 RepID=UPI0004C15131|nr:VanZ family protein [Streptomyces sp. NRRL S-813]